MKVEIDQNSGYCFGVEYAIQMAEDEMANAEKLYCLGDIVHNRMEVERLYKLGLRIIERDQLKDIRDTKVLIRAHGEPPETYKIAIDNNIELIDASCPVVLKLQNRVKHAYDRAKEMDGQIVIYGKPGHAEVIGLTGQTLDEAIIISGEEDLDKLNFDLPIILFSQTTKSTKGFYYIKQCIEERIRDRKGTLRVEDFEANDSICRQVSNREPKMVDFASRHDVVLFVAGKKSSNGKALYTVCLEANPRSYFIENEEEIESHWFSEANSIGICGATSTPGWLMERVASAIRRDFSLKSPV